MGWFTQIQLYKLVIYYVKAPPHCQITKCPPHSETNNYFGANAPIDFSKLCRPCPFSNWDILYDPVKYLVQLEFLLGPIRIHFQHLPNSILITLITYNLNLGNESNVNASQRQHETLLGTTLTPSLHKVYCGSLAPL
jgi:hypothetical protein